MAIRYRNEDNRLVCGDTPIKSIIKGETAFYGEDIVPVFVFDETGTKITALTEYGKTKKDIIIPDNVKGVAASAMISCDKVENIYIPSSVTDIEDGAFAGAKNLRNIYVDEKNDCYKSVNGILYSKNGGELLQFPPFNDIKDFVVPSEVYRIATSAFYFANITAVYLPDGINIIDDTIFLGCESLQEIYIPISIINIDTSLVVRESKEKVKFYCETSSKPTDWTFTWNILGQDNGSYIYGDVYWGYNNVDTNDEYEYFIRQNNCALLYKYKKNDIPTSIIVPEFIDGYKVIGLYGTFGDMNSEVGSSKFAQIESVSLPASTTIIGDYAFSMCTSLKSINIPSNVKIIGFYAFCYCGLDEIFLPSGLCQISGFSFFLCSNLTKIAIPNNVSYIKEGAFCNCTNVREVTIGSGVKRIDGLSFVLGNTSDKATIYVLAIIPPQIESNTFVKETIEQIKVPNANVEAYKNASNWSDLADIITGIND